MKILVINAGSSSLKFQLFDMPLETPVCSGLAERIGSEKSFIKYRAAINGHEKFFENNMPIPDHTVALKEILALLNDSETGIIKDINEIAAVGHRVVHGGEDFTKATLVTAAVKEKVKNLFSLAPLHNPLNYRCIELAEKTLPHAKQVAVFDTAFHQSMAAHAFRYAIPASYYKDEKIRVYGFHGTSHKYVTQEAIKYLQKPAAKIISIHLGNGCSITAVEGNRSLDTSMGFSPLNGLVMGTRSGDIDPSVLLHLIAKLGLSSEQINTLLNKQSGMLGLCGFNDMRDVNKAIDAGNKDAAFAYELYAYRIKKYIGAYVAVLNGLDALVFTAGVGENDSNIRELVCSNLEFFKIHLNMQRNRVKKNETHEINDPGAEVKILVIPTNEELEIAKQCYEM